MVFGRRGQGGKKRERGCICCRRPHAGRPISWAAAAGGSMVMAAFHQEERAAFQAEGAGNDGGLLDLIQLLNSSNLLPSDPRTSNQERKTKLAPPLAKQVAAAAQARAQSTAAQSPSPRDRQANRPRVAPFEIEELVLGKLLGVGGFSCVHEIKAFDLSASSTNGAAAGSSASTTSATSATSATSTWAGTNNAKKSAILKRLSSARSSLKNRPLNYNRKQRVAREFLSQHAVRRPQDETTNDKPKTIGTNEDYKQDENKEGAGGQEELSTTWRGSEASSMDDIVLCGLDPEQESRNRTKHEEEDVVATEEKQQDHRDSSHANGMKEDQEGDDYHDDANNTNSKKKEVARYAIKHLKASLLHTPEKFARAAMDLACEAEMLLCLDHPNIVKLRGWSAHGPSAYKSGDHNAYFLVIDRLVDTLQDRVYSWRRSWKQLHREGLPSAGAGAGGNGGRLMVRWLQNCLPSAGKMRTKAARAQMLSEQRDQSSKASVVSSRYGSEDDATANGSSSFLRRRRSTQPCELVLDRQSVLQQRLDALLMERLQVAYDIACAMEYLHEKRIIYRDLKTTNVGFDIRGNVKLFDFGLSRYLPAPETISSGQGLGNDEVYVMGNVGTRRYTAPEVTENKKYNQKADVYSFGAVLWEVLSMSSPKAHRICPFTGTLLEAQKLNPCPCWPVELQDLVASTLHPEFQNRPTMARARTSLEEFIRRTLWSGDNANKERRGGSRTSLEMVNHNEDGLGFFGRQRRRSTFRLDSFNTDDLTELESLQAMFPDEDYFSETTTSLQEEDDFVVVVGRTSSVTNITSISSSQYSQNTN